ncbi:MAG: carboxyltransferase domain-containing protein, partial [Campylobacterota bacterium]|nr:carboxyltransferase domain-containing protein [Campylobacterota bacterium]
MNFQIASVDSIIIYFGDTISQKVSNEVLDSFKIIEESNLKNIIEVVPSYTSIYIQFDIFSYTHEELYTIIKDIV